MMGREGQVTGFVIQARSSDQAVDRRRCGSGSRPRFPGVAATPARDHVERDVQIRLAKAMAWATTVLALILGSVGMLNTMIMAVFERTREIGILRALGWRRRRVLALILGEAVCLGLVGAVARDRAGGHRPAGPAAGPDRPGIHRPQPAPGGPLASGSSWASC